ncbi:hypothetical protein [Halostagnicola kamekurae]|uniref:DUF8098 domain-containing protein n=1 Tax=Halostagnicola kamekurae TaxID=619731 RepID=A0A1I6PQR4_9EURY|nr:hypothetical protein [Halostagnicola kamekurae]SFS42408.1 hypothetical protein SAMN04488556_0719 [Halostagnicola kamekurae]
MLTLSDEDDLLEDIMEGVEIALARTGFDGEHVDPITVNKLAYLAIQEFEPPITYGWYKYGPAPVNVARRTVDLTPRPLAEVPAADEPRVRDPTGKILSPREYSHFFSSDLEEFQHILETPTKEYLVEFYFDHAPDEYRDLYIASAELQQVLDEIKTPAWHADATGCRTRLERRFPRLVTEVHSHDILSESVSAVDAYERVVTRIVATASEQGELSESQQRFINRAVDHFYSTVWKYVALLVSRDTVDRSPGTNQRALRNNIESDLRTIRDEWEVELERLEELATGFDLYSELGATAQSVDHYDGDDESGTASVDEMLELIE